MLRVSVEGGTGAGVRRPLVVRVPWTCVNGHRCEAWHARCLVAGCNDKRPN